MNKCLVGVALRSAQTVVEMRADRSGLRRLGQKMEKRHAVSAAAACAEDALPRRSHSMGLHISPDALCVHPSLRRSMET